MGLPEYEPRYYIQGECPDCGYGHLAVWDTKPTEDDLLTRRCLCVNCGCWFDETLRLELRAVDITRVRRDGEEERRTDGEHHDNCPFCGKPLEEDEPYFGDEEQVGYEKTNDVQDGIYPRRLYCLDCHADLRETYKMVRAGTQIVRVGMGAEGSDCCPECGSGNRRCSISQEGSSTHELLCECQECGCEYLLRTEETYNQTRVVADRDGWYADGDHETLFFNRVAVVGELCPMCGCGTVGTSADYEGDYHFGWRGLRGSRAVGCECPECFTQYEDLYDTRVVERKVVKNGRRQVLT